MSAPTNSSRAALALRVIAILELVSVARLLAFGFLEDSAMDELRSGQRASGEVFAKLETLSSISLWVHVALVTGIVAAVVLLAVSAKQARAWAFGAAGALLVHFALLLASRLREAGAELTAWHKLTWWAEGATLAVGLALPLVAALRARPGSLGRIGVAGAGVIVLLDVGASAYGFSAETYPPMLAWIERVTALVGAAWFAGIAFPLAKRIASGEDSAPVRAAPDYIDGTPLRLLGWALIARIGAGIALQIPLTLSMVNGDYDSAGSLTTLGVGVGVLISIGILAALVRYQRFPETHRSDSLVLAIGLLLVGVALDIWAGVAADKLFALAGQAKRASSFWSMPSFSEIEALQTTLTWGGRASVLVGIGAGLALMSSLKATARAVGSDELAERAGRAVGLLIAAGVGGVLTGVLMESLKRDAMPILLLLAAALLIVAILLLATWTKLLFGLATELERGPPPSRSE